MNQFVIIARLYKPAGNTYHSVEVYVNCKFIGRVDYAYGYDDAYKQTALEILDRAGYVIQGENYYYDFERRVGIENVLYSYTWVTRRKDL